MKRQQLLARLRDLVILLLAVTTALFFMLRLAGDPAMVLAGADATPEQLAALRAQYGLDRPLPIQFLLYLWSLLHFDFGASLASGVPAMEKVMDMLPATLKLSGLAMAFTIISAIPLGVWIGARPETPARRIVAAIVFVLQGTPGFVVGLIMIQVFAVDLGWLPSMGHEDVSTWILPTVSLGAFLIPKLTRVVATNINEALQEDYIRTARASGASEFEVLWSFALPNAMLGTTALIGTMFAFLVSGAVVTEIIFSWPGIGWLLIESTQNLDFPVVQAIALVITVLVFAINTLADVLFGLLDPRIRVRT
jgi:ABC-type dipeptide/oligopeptide/nickel transport system permease component